MGGGRDFTTGKSIYIRRGGVYIRRDGKPIERKNQPEQKNKNVPSTLKNFDGHVSEAEKALQGYSPEERQEIEEGLGYIREFIEKSDLRVRVRMETMSKILDSGELWNQMQAGRSGGAYIPDERRRLSQTMFGHDGNLSDEEYEKYGYIGDGTHENVAWWYGDVDIVLKKDAVMDRATMTLGDSLDYRALKPSFVSNPQFLSSGSGERISSRQFLRKAERLRDTGAFEDDSDGYAELQLHGRVTTEQFDHVSVPKSWQGSRNKKVRDLISKIENTGLKVTYDNHERTRF